MIAMGITGMQYYSNATLWPRLNQLLYATTPVEKGGYAEILPIGSILGGVFMCFSKKIGYQRWQVFGAIAVQTACVGGLTKTSIDNPAAACVLNMIVSLCTSIVILNCLVTITFGIVNQDDIGSAAGIAGTSRLMFGAVALAIFSNITNGKYADRLPIRVTENVEGLGFDTTNLKALAAAARLGTAKAYSAVSGITPEVRAAATLANKEAYLDGAHLGYQVALAFGIVGCIAALFIPSIDERKYSERTVALQEQDRLAVEAKRAEKA